PARHSYGRAHWDYCTSHMQLGFLRVTSDPCAAGALRRTDIASLRSRVPSYIQLTIGAQTEKPGSAAVFGPSWLLLSLIHRPARATSAHIPQALKELPQ